MTLAAEQRAVATTRTLTGSPAWSGGGSSRIRREPGLDGAIARQLDTGQVASVYRGGAVFIQVKRLVAAPAGLAAPVVPPPVPAPPDAGPLLDEAFGPESR